MTETGSPAHALPSLDRAHGWMDALRIVAAAVVVANHARDLLWVDYAGPIVWSPVYLLSGFGHEAVIVFFVLSGYWITGSITRRMGDGGFWPDYLGDRIVRLYAVLIPALMLGGILDAVGAHLLDLPVYDGASGARTVAAPVADRLDLTTLAINLTFLQDLAGPTWGSNGALWSLSYEFWYYIWYPALALSFVRRRPSLLLCSLAIGVLYPEVAFGFLAWLAGSALFFAVRRQSAIGAAMSRAPIVWLVAAAALNGAVLLYARNASGPVSDLIVAAAFSALLYVLCHAGRRIPSAPGRLASYGRDFSFSLYAIHLPLCTLVAGIVLSAAGGQRLAPTFPSFLGIVALMILCFGAARGFALATEAQTGRLRALVRRMLAHDERDASRNGAGG